MAVSWTVVETLIFLITGAGAHCDRWRYDRWVL
ncbi:hypothetical protein N579_00945 [Corynebacterium pseudodiphtheriticum 090104]|nr:hypothetical protein N579_00945 [Corynebacterium pseudodiphtheriticum 090104]